MKRDIFENNVRDAKGYIFAYYLIAIVCFVGPLFSLYLYLDEKLDIGLLIAISVVFAFVLLLWIIYVILSIHVARHPGRYNKKQIKFFFQDGSIIDESKL